MLACCGCSPSVPPPVAQPRVEAPSRAQESISVAAVPIPGSTATAGLALCDNAGIECRVTRAKRCMLPARVRQLVESKSSWEGWVRRVPIPVEDNQACNDLDPEATPSDGCSLTAVANGCGALVETYASCEGDSCSSRRTLLVGEEPPFVVAQGLAPSATGGQGIDVLLPERVVVFDRGADMQAWKGDETPPPYLGTELISASNRKIIAKIPYGRCVADPLSPSVVCRDTHDGQGFLVDAQGHSKLVTSFPVARMFEPSLATTGPYQPLWNDAGQLVLGAEAADPRWSAGGDLVVVEAVYQWPVEKAPAAPVRVGPAQ